MPWAHNEPQTLEEKVELVRGFRGQFDTDQDYVYGIFSRDESEVLGGTGLHKRHGEDAFEIADGGVIHLAGSCPGVRDVDGVGLGGRRALGYGRRALGGRRRAHGHIHSATHNRCKRD